MEEDIKKIQDLIQRCKECKFATCEQCEINWNDVQAIENVLSELKTYREKIIHLSDEEYRKVIENAQKDIKSELETYKDKCIELSTDIDALETDLIEHEKTSFEFQEENIKLRKELETYKKIAEKLAEQLSYRLTILLGARVNSKELIKKARKEVEKED